MDGGGAGGEGVGTGGGGTGEGLGPGCGLGVGDGEGGGAGVGTGGGGAGVGAAGGLPETHGVPPGPDGFGVAAAERRMHMPFFPTFFPSHSMLQCAHPGTDGQWSQHSAGSSVWYVLRCESSCQHCDPNGAAHFSPTSAV